MKTSIYSEKNKHLDILVKKVKGFSEMYPNTNSRRAKMFTFVSSRLTDSGFMNEGYYTAGFAKLLDTVGDMEFEDVASFEKYLLSLK